MVSRFTTGSDNYEHSKQDYKHFWLIKGRRTHDLLMHHYSTAARQINVKPPVIEDKVKDKFGIILGSRIYYSLRGLKFENIKGLTARAVIAGILNCMSH